MKHLKVTVKFVLNMVFVLHAPLSKDFFWFDIPDVDLSVATRTWYHNLHMYFWTLKWHGEDRTPFLRLKEK